MLTNKKIILHLGKWHLEQVYSPTAGALTLGQFAGWSSGLTLGQFAGWSSGLYHKMSDKTTTDDDDGDDDDGKSSSSSSRLQAIPLFEVYIQARDLHFRHDPNCRGTPLQIWICAVTGTWTSVACVQGQHANHYTNGAHTSVTDTLLLLAYCLVQLWRKFSSTSHFKQYFQKSSNIIGI